MVESAPPFKAFIDPDDPAFLPPGDMPARVIDYCRRSGQPTPENDAEVMATVYVSLAYKYRYVLEQLIAVSGRDVDLLHIIGGGSQNALLNQMTANAIGRPVIAGPAEATATGNAIAQLIAIGELGGVADARAMLERRWRSRPLRAAELGRLGCALPGLAILGTNRLPTNHQGRVLAQRLAGDLFSTSALSD